METPGLKSNNMVLGIFCRIFLCLQVRALCRFWSSGEPCRVASFPCSHVGPRRTGTGLIHHPIRLWKAMLLGKVFLKFHFTATAWPLLNTPLLHSHGVCTWSSGRSRSLCLPLPCCELLEDTAYPSSSWESQPLAQDLSYSGHLLGAWISQTLRHSTNC